MKKLLLIFALIAVYGISVSNVSAKVIDIQKAEISVVADSNDNDEITVEDDKKDKKEVKETKACCSETTTGCSKSQKKSCEASKKSCCSEKKNE